MEGAFWALPNRAKYPHIAREIWGRLKRVSLSPVGQCPLARPEMLAVICPWSACTNPIGYLKSYSLAMLRLQDGRPRIHRSAGSQVGGALNPYILNP